MCDFRFKTSAKDGTNISKWISFLLSKCLGHVITPHTDEAMNCLVQNILNLTHKPAERLPEAISLKPVSMSQPTHGDGDSVDSDASGTATTTEKKPFFRNCSCQN